MPDIQDLRLAIHDVVVRQLIVPVGTTIRVPDDHEWGISALAALPHPQYSPPGGERDPYAFGDICLQLGDLPTIRMNAYTLMDRYWGRYNLTPELPEVVAKLEEAQHAIQSAPTIPGLALAIEQAAQALSFYQQQVMPDFKEQMLLVKERGLLTVQQVACQRGHEAVPITYHAVDVELHVIIKRPVYGREAQTEA